MLNSPWELFLWTMTWLYKNEPMTTPPEGVMGFVYEITNLLDGRKYIGKKKLSFTRSSLKTVTLKNGTKKKKKVKKVTESDWLDYYGSSEELCKDVETLGRENFKREILMFCSKVGQLSYFEAKFQFINEVLEHPDKYYNAWISARVRRNHL